MTLPNQPIQPTQPPQPTDSTPSTSIQRPMGVTILAVLAGIGGVLGLLGSLGFMAFAGLAGGIWMILGLLLVAISIAYLVFAYGAWNLRPWAWSLGVGLSAASIALTLLQLMQGVTNFVSALISIAISAVILYYLFTPEVKAAFGKA